MSEITESWISESIQRFEASPASKALQGAVCKMGAEAICLDRAAVSRSADFGFSLSLDQTWSVTNQKSTGRCWIFAGLNTFRVAALPRMNVNDIEFSQAFVYFWCKLERTNYIFQFLEDTYSTLPDGDRTLDWILDHPIDDGGQWDLFSQVIQKYGIVPKSIFPETDACEHSQSLNGILVALIRETAHSMRGSKSKEECKEIRSNALKKVFHILCLHLGTPPSTFSFQWIETASKKKPIHRIENVTPLQFMKDFVFSPLSTITPEIIMGSTSSRPILPCDYVSLVHDPRESSPAMRTFTVDLLGIVVGKTVVYLNVPNTNILKTIAIKMLSDGLPVWFGCDSSKSKDKKEGIFDDKLYDYQSLFGFASPGSSLTKAQRLVYHSTLMTHAMMFTGVDLDSNSKAAKKWKVENSWGESSGKKGVFTMSDSWFDEYLFEISAPKKYLDQELLDALKLEPIKLPCYDPMGALAFHSD